MTKVEFDERQKQEAWKMIRRYSCYVIPNNHEYKFIKGIGGRKVYECVHCKELYVINEQSQK